MLIDKNGDGKATKAVTFYQGPEIYGPIGVCVAPYPDGKGQKVLRLPVAGHPRVRGQGRRPEGRRPAARSSSPASAGSTTTTASTASTSARTASSTSPSATRA